MCNGTLRNDNKSRYNPPFLDFDSYIFIGRLRVWMAPVVTLSMVEQTRGLDGIYISSCDTFVE